MANWKKVIVSGSAAELLNINVTNAVTASYFKGDGSALTGVAASGLDIEGFTDGTGITVLTSDKLLLSDAGTEKYITVSQLPFNNTTYSVTDGELSQNNFTNTDHSKLDAIEASADVTDATNVTAAGALMDSELTSIADVKALNQSVISGATPTFTTTNFTDATNKRLMTDAQETKLDSVESSADVTDATNVTAAGALMDSEVTSLALIKSLTAADISGSSTTLTQEQVEDFAGAMVASGGTKTGITITYQDSTGDMDFVVATQAPTLAGDVTGVSSGNSVVKIQGVAITSGEATQIAAIGSTTISAGQWGYLGGLDQDVKTNSNVTHANLTLTGNLDVQGTTVTLNTANLNIEDKFILLASGSTGNVDAGIIFQSNTNGSGESFFFDAGTTRPAWSTTDVAYNATAVTPTSFIPRVFDTTAGQSVIAERGSIKVTGDDIYIYS